MLEYINRIGGGVRAEFLSFRNGVYIVRGIDRRTENLIGEWKFFSDEKSAREKFDAILAGI